MERLTLATLLHLPTLVLHVTDLTADCGMPLAEQWAVRCVARVGGGPGRGGSVRCVGALAVWPGRDGSVRCVGGTSPSGRAGALADAARGRSRTHARACDGGGLLSLAPTGEVG